MKETMTELLKKTFKNKKVLVTGHTGFKGSWLTQMLLLWDADVVGISLEPETNPNLFSELDNEKEIEHYIADVTDYENIESIFLNEKPDIVFHLAAQPIVRRGYDEPRLTFGTNTLGTVNVLEAIRNTDTVKAAVMVTTDKVYENDDSGNSFQETDRLGGHDPYSASKAAAELAIHAYKKSFLIKKEKPLIASARAGNVIGGGDWSRDRIMADFVKNIFEEKQSVTLRNLQAIRPWQFVLEPLYGYCLLAHELYQGNTFAADAWNFGPLEKNNISVKKIVEESMDYLNKGDFVEEQKADTDTELESGILTLDITKTSKKLGWMPVYGFTETIQNTLKWYDYFYNGGDVKEFTKNQIRSYLNRQEENQLCRFKKQQ